MVLAALLTLSVRLIGESGRNLTTVFLSFSFALWLFTDLYWLIYDLMRPETRMPFAANEIGESAMFLMNAAIVNSAVRHRIRPPFGVLFGTLIFSVANVILWILWSGETVQDLFIGTVFAWSLYSIVRSLWWSNALNKREWILLSLLCAAIILCQALTFILPENIKNIPDLSAYVLLIAGILFFVCILIKAFRGNLPYTQLFLSFALVTWITLAKYMSGGNWYNLFLTLETFGMPLWYLLTKKVVKAE